MTKTATTNMPPAATVAGAEVDLRMLGIYLNDHRAGATAGLEIARRSLGSNRGNAYGDFLERLAVEIEEDLHTLEDLMDTLGIGRDRPKSTAAWLGEKAGRLKLNGRLLSYSPMSRVVEIEVLCLGVE